MDVALQATIEGGKVSVQRAGAYLKAQEAAEAKAALDRAKAFVAKFCIEGDFGTH
jgi:hypothetical protein